MTCVAYKMSEACVAEFFVLIHVNLLAADHLTSRTSAIPPADSEATATRVMSASAIVVENLYEAIITIFAMTA